MNEEIKDLLETLVFMERNNLDHLIRTGQAIKWRKSIEQLQQENEELKQKYSKLENKYIKNQSCCNEEDCDLYKEYLNDKNISTEFEKWLEDTYNYIGSTDVSKVIEKYNFIFNIAEASVMLNTIEYVKYKLQELKEGKK